MANKSKKVVKKQQPALKTYYIAVGFEENDVYAQSGGACFSKKDAVQDLCDAYSIEERTIVILEVKLASPKKVNVVTDYPVLKLS